MAYMSGKSGWLRLSNNANITARSWALSLNAARVDVTNFTSGGFSESLAGFASGTVSAQGPLDSALQLTVGDTLTNMSLGIGNNYFVTFSGVLTKVDVSTAVDKAGEFNFELATNGVFNTTFATAS